MDNSARKDRRGSSVRRYKSQFSIRHSAIPAAGIALTLLLTMFGGASRNEFWIQPLVQFGAIVITAAALIRPALASASIGIKPMTWGTIAMAALMASQLIPLPPGIWRALPGHEVAVSVSDAVGLGSSWRPLSMDPDDTLSALLGMIVPAAVLVVFTRMPASLVKSMMWLFVIVGAAELIVSIGQLITQHGALFFYPDMNGEVAGFFNNRNHTAIFLGTIPPIITYIALEMRLRSEKVESIWVAAGIGFALDGTGVVLTGSRIGVAVFILTALASCLMVWKTKAPNRVSKRRPSKSIRHVAIYAGCLLIAVLLVGLFVTQGDTSLTRIGETDLTTEGRMGLWQPLQNLLWHYFPFGSGFGSFDRVYRMLEPDTQLKLTYLNHAHNDFVEVVIEGGLAALVLCVVLLVIGIRAAANAWNGRAQFEIGRNRAQVGSIVAAGLLLGSLTDYPLRTPMLAGWMALALCMLFNQRPANSAP